MGIISKYVTIACHVITNLHLLIYSDEELLEPPTQADHNVLRTVNSTRMGGSVTDEFEMFDEGDNELDQMMRSSMVSDERSGLEFKPVTKKKPVPSADEKNLLRDEMFSMLDSFRTEEENLVIINVLVCQQKS